MRKSLVLAVVITALACPAGAQTANERIPKAKPVERPATDAEKKPGFFKRVFGKNTPEPTPTPVPAAKPTPRPKPRIRTTPTPTPDPAPDSTTPPEPAPASTPPAPQPDPAAKPANIPPEPKPKPAKPATPEKPAKPEKPDYSGMSDREKYQTVRKLAQEDARVKTLAAKAESELSASAAASAAAEYNRALFQKIRQLEPSLDAYVDGVEAAMTKRLNTEKKAN